MKFSDVAKSNGYNHIDREDIEDIVKHVKKIAPQLRAYCIGEDTDKVKTPESRWNTLYFTDLELD